MKRLQRTCCSPEYLSKSTTKSIEGKTTAETVNVPAANIEVLDITTLVTKPHNQQITFKLEKEGIVADARLLAIRCTCNSLLRI